MMRKPVTQSEGVNMKRYPESTRLVATIILSLILAMVAGLGGCITAPEPPAAVPPATSPPQYHILSFILEGNASDSFPVYIRDHQTLHFFMETDSSKPVDQRGRVWVHIFTPSGKMLGSYGLQPNNPGQYAGGTLSEGFAQGFSTFHTRFSPVDYGWGEGYYRFELVNEFGQTTRVRVEYWLED
ncbi:hypothetical protein ES703_67454 [subsurface metagenome]